MVITPSVLHSAAQCFQVYPCSSMQMCGCGCVWLCPARSCKTRTVSYNFIQSSHGQHWLQTSHRASTGQWERKALSWAKRNTKETVGIKSCVWKTRLFLAKSALVKGLAKDDYQWSELNTRVKGFWYFLLQLNCLQYRHPSKNAGLRQWGDVVTYKFDLI